MEQVPTRFITPNTNKKLRHDAWQIAVSYFLTGEDASFRGVKPKQDFDFGTGWGAWELVARYSEINLDEDTFKRPYRHVIHRRIRRLVNQCKIGSLLDWRCELVSESKHKSGIELFAYHIRWWRRCWDFADQRSRNKCARSSRRKRIPHSITARILIKQLSLTRTWRNGS